MKQRIITGLIFAAVVAGIILPGQRAPILPILWAQWRVMTNFRVGGGVGAADQGGGLWLTDSRQVAHMSGEGVIEFGVVPSLDATGPFADVFAAPSISVKLSALHPRYEHAKRARVLSELGAGLLELAQLAKSYGIGLTIDAERLLMEVDLDARMKRTANRPLPSRHTPE